MTHIRHTNVRITYTSNPLLHPSCLTQAHTTFIYSPQTKELALVKTNVTNCEVALEPEGHIVRFKLALDAHKQTRVRSACPAVKNLLLGWVIISLLPFIKTVKVWSHLIFSPSQLTYIHVWCCMLLYT